MPKLPARDSEPQRESPYAVAINLFDINRIDSIIRGCLRLADILDLKSDDIVKVDPDRMDEAGVIFTCPLLQAATVCDVIRTKDRNVGQYPTRVYVRRKSWAKVSGATTLSIVVNGQVALNPQVFTPAEGERPVIGGGGLKPRVKVF